MKLRSLRARLIAGVDDLDGRHPRRSCAARHSRWSCIFPDRTWLIHNSMLTLSGVIIVAGRRLGDSSRAVAVPRCCVNVCPTCATVGARRLSGEYPTEVVPLVDDLNSLLEERERRVARAVAKAGDLAHGLKTPLAVLAKDIDGADAAGQHDLAASMRRQVERMRRQIDWHLAQARATAAGPAPERARTSATAPAASRGRSSASTPIARSPSRSTFRRTSRRASRSRISRRCSATCSTTRASGRSRACPSPPRSTRRASSSTWTTTGRARSGDARPRPQSRRACGRSGAGIGTRPGDRPRAGRGLRRKRRARSVARRRRPRASYSAGGGTSHSAVTNVPCNGSNETLDYCMFRNSAVKSLCYETCNISHRSRRGRAGNRDTSPCADAPRLRTRLRSKLRRGRLGRGKPENRRQVHAVQAAERPHGDPA